MASLYMLFGTEQQAARQKVLQASIHPRHFGQYDQLPPGALPVVGQVDPKQNPMAFSLSSPVALSIRSVSTCCSTPSTCKVVLETVCPLDLPLNSFARLCNIDLVTSGFGPAQAWNNLAG